MRFLLVAVLLLAGEASAFAADAERTVTRWSGGRWTVWRVDGVPGERALTEHAEIQLGGRDVVTLDAGGCVSAVSIQLPGDAAPSALAGRLRRPIAIPEGVAFQPLRLGFGSCAAAARAHVFVAVQRTAEASSPPSPMDLVWGDSTDTNGLPLNPKWGLQETDGALPNAAEICFSVPGYFENPLCSTQHPSTDTGAGIRRRICSIGAETPIAGHVNWYPSTVEGPIFWDSLSLFDRDCNVRLVPPAQNALTVHNPENIKGEFDSRETIKGFSTPWWKRFRTGGDQRKKQMIDGRPAILSGLVGIDCEHGCPSEVHPVWVLAIHVGGDAGDDVWALFMRNWGNEGFCSSLQHEVNWPDDRFTLTLPWRDGASAVRVGTRTTFVGNVEGIEGFVRDVPGTSVNVTFALPPPSARAIVHGELHLSWTGGARGTESARAVPEAPDEWERQGGEGEALVDDLVARLAPEQRRAIGIDAEPAAAPDAVRVRLRRVSSPAEEADASAAVSVTSRPDPARAAAEERRLRALLDAFGEKVPGPIGRALDRTPPGP